MQHVKSGVMLYVRYSKIGHQMPLPEQTYHAIGAGIPEAVASQMFGKKCFKVNGKAFICFFQDCMVFKLTGADHSEALSIAGATLFDPSGKGRHMREWVQVPFDSHLAWERFARSALQYCISK